MQEKPQDTLFTIGGNTINPNAIDVIEKRYDIKLADEIDIKSSSANKLKLNDSICSCNNTALLYKFKITSNRDDIFNNCVICRNNLNTHCIEHEKKNQPLCKIVKGDCNHKYHHCCIVKWLKTRAKCILCNKNWKENKTDALTISYKNITYDFDFDLPLDILNKLIEEIFNVDTKKLKLTLNGSYVNTVSAGFYGLCTPDAHKGYGSFKIDCVLFCERISQEVEYDTTLIDLKILLSKKFDVFIEKVQIYYNDIELTRDMDKLTMFKLDIHEDSMLEINIITEKYKMDIEENFVVLYSKSEILFRYSIIEGSLAWLPYPYFRDTIKAELSNLVSSLYMLCIYVNRNKKKISDVCDNFEAYMKLYELFPPQINRAKLALMSFLSKKNLSDKNKKILSCSITELISKILLKNKIQSNYPLLSCNILCNLLYYSKKKSTINWQNAVEYMKLKKIFSIYSPLEVLKNKIPIPSLVLDDNMDILILNTSSELVLNNLLYNNLKLYSKEEMEIMDKNIKKNIYTITTYKEEPPNEYICPIVHSIMTNPVLVSDGFSYEKSALERWLVKSNTSPITRENLNKDIMIDNKNLKKLIVEWIEKNRINNILNQSIYWI